MSCFCDIENRAIKTAAPGIDLRTFWGREMLVSVVDLAPGAVLPDHSHPHEQAGTILSGEMEMTIDGETRNLTAGDTYIIPGGVPHSAVAGEKPVRVIDVFSPVREDYQY
ncbi:cupin domain-containing protein [bacterium]|nr:cupin domain-containing protein [bacterium]